MTFDNAQQIESVMWQMKMADYVRSTNRARINDLFNGFPPYTEDEVEANNINVNVNFLESTTLAHDARSQFYQAFLKPGNFFKASIDSGPRHKRNLWSAIVTKEISKVMKKSLPYMECMRSKFAMNVLHGIAPAAFRNSESWCPDAIGVDDVMIPSNTLLTMVNLPFFGVYRSFTAPELIKLTRGPGVDFGWNKKLVNACIEWVDSQTIGLLSDSWPDIWSPEKAQERVKQSNGSYYLGDASPVIRCWDVYFWNDSKGVQGWNRRIVLDAWSEPTMNAEGQVIAGSRIPRKNIDKLKGQFLFNPGDQKFGDSLSQLINWQFADLSSVAPFQYHSVRSLGFLLYSVCHLQNRLRCRFSETVFEQMMNLFRVKSGEDIQRVLKVNLINQGLVDDNVEFIRSEERHQVDYQLCELGLRENKDIIARNSSSYTTTPQQPNSSKEKTKFEVMTEVNAMTSLVSAALLQAYAYQNSEYREIFRRFCIKNSNDPQVREFQAAAMRQGVPAEMLSHEMWDIEPERVMGAGNKTLEVAIATQLMQARNLYDPEPQREILRDFTLAITDDPARAMSLVPENPNPVTDAAMIAALAMGTLMRGLPVPIKTGINHIDYVQTMMKELGMLVKKHENNVPPADDIVGMNAVSQHLKQHIEIIAQDKGEKQRVKQYSDILSKLDNEIRAFAQRYVEQQKQQQAQGQQQQDPETQAKIQSMLIIAKAKADNTRESHAQRTAQRQIAFELEEQRKQKEFQMEMHKGRFEQGREMLHTEADHRQEMRHKEVKGQHEIKLAKRKALASSKSDDNA